MLAAISFARLFEFGKLQALSAIILIAMCFAFSYPFAPSPYTQNQSSAADFIIQNYGKGTTVLADYETSYLLAYKGAVVYVGPYMERFSDASQRMKTAQDFFSLGDNSALSIWQPECILFRQVPISPLPAGYKQVYSNPEARVFCYLG
jgi:hypothetical protein